MIPYASLSSVTGLSCPASGIWESLGNFRTTIPLSKGEMMPYYCGRKICWKLIIAC